ncbi:MAG: hypothetical protein IPK04_08855 [Bdellovibrionales bacterium]|nr:hypothetical protein [Bdellovibrionales bacterium]
MKTIYLGSMELLLSIFLCLGFSNANASDHHPEDHFSHLPQGGRKGLHGMVLFGSDPYFLEHIPMLTPPHDFQIITEIILKNEKGLAIKSGLFAIGFYSAT